MRALFVLLLAGCTKSTPPSTTAPSSSAVPIASASVAVATAGIPSPDFGPRGPIVATGYPTKIGTGMDDSAEYVGFTSDGSKFGYCLHHGGLGQLDCVMRDAAGKDSVDSDVVAHPETAPSPLDPVKTKAIKAWIASSGISALTRVKGTMEWNPPPLKGDWAYARDIRIVVTTGDGTIDKAGRVTSQPFVTLGGTLKGEQPVVVATSSAPHRKIFDAGEMPYHFTVVNGLQLSPDGTELGMVTHSYCMEYCDDFEVFRITANALAGQVYNDTGFRHHKKGEYARSAELFLLAAFADTKSDTYAYNLACAWARLGDPKSKDALALAIARGGDKIKTRAKADEDFASVKSETWFVDQTR
jgi:hypothetical protein